VIGLVAALIIVIGLALTFLVSNLDRIVKNVIETVGPEVTGTSVSVDAVSISLRSGKGSLARLAIGNPPGFSGADAFTLNEISIGLNLESLMSDVIVIEQILIDGASLNFEQQGRSSNFQQILDNIETSSDSGGEASDSASDPGPRLIVDEFHFTSGSITAGLAQLDVQKTIIIPNVVVRDVGRKSGGAAVAEVTRQLLEPVLREAIEAAAGASLDDIKDQVRQQADEVIQEKQVELENKFRNKLFN